VGIVEESVEIWPNEVCDIITVIEDGRCFLTQSFMDILCSIGIGSLFANLTINLSTNINPVFSSSVFLGQNKNKWSISKQ